VIDTKASHLDTAWKKQILIYLSVETFNSLDLITYTPGWFGDLL